MITGKILRDLWRLRLAVAVVAVIAVAIGYLMVFKPSFPPQGRAYTVSVASARILVDTPDSQVVEVAPRGSDALGARANVLANLMVDGTVKDAIARKAGLDPRKLYAGVQATPADTADAPVVPARPDVWALTTSVVTTSDQSTDLPLIKIEAQAPTTAGSLKLAGAAVAGLGEYLNTKAASEQVADSRRLRVDALGAAQAHDETLGPGKLMGLVATIFVLLSGCAALLGGCALVRGWRAVDAFGSPAETLDELWYSDPLPTPDEDGEQSDAERLRV